MSYPDQLPPARDEGSSLILGVMVHPHLRRRLCHLRPRRVAERRLPRRRARHCLLCGGLPGGMGAAEMSEFRECASCASKPGAPQLCQSCLVNREIAGRVDVLIRTNNEYLERALKAEANAAPDWLPPAFRRAEAHGRFADLNHVLGVLVEELDEFKDEVRRNHPTRARLELIDIVGASLKAIRQIHDGEL